MYLDFYGLKEKPFSLTPDPQYLFLSEGHRTAIESLLYGIHHRQGFMVLTGDIGTGKTTICRALLGKLDKNVKTAVIFNSFLTEEELLESILLEFGFTSKGKTRKERIDGLNRVLIHFLSRGLNAVLIVDEAQNLSIPVLEQIRMLSNLETEKEKLLQIVLLGQLELDRKLLLPELRQLNQRIAIRLRLLPLSRSETERYIHQRLTIAGSKGDLVFSRSALEEIHRFSRGIPRLINLLCERALLAGFVAQTLHFEKALIKRAEKSLLGEETRRLPVPLPRRFSLLRALSLGVVSLLMLLVLFWKEPIHLVWDEAKAFVSKGFPVVHSSKPGKLARPLLPPSRQERKLNEGKEKIRGELSKDDPKEKTP